MLVLSRRVNESLRIGEGVVVTVVRIRGDKVRLGVTAPGAVITRHDPAGVPVVYRRGRFHHGEHGAHREDLRSQI